MLIDRSYLNREIFYHSCTYLYHKEQRSWSSLAIQKSVIHSSIYLYEHFCQSPFFFTEGLWRRDRGRKDFPRIGVNYSELPSLPIFTTVVPVSNRPLTMNCRFFSWLLMSLSRSVKRRDRSLLPCNLSSDTEFSWQPTCTYTLS